MAESENNHTTKTRTTSTMGWHAQRERDHQTPFRDRMFETPQEAAERIAAINKTTLESWWRRFRDYSHLATYGQTGCEQTCIAAYDLFETERNGTNKHPLAIAVQAIWDGRPLTLAEVTPANIYDARTEGGTPSPVMRAIVSATQTQWTMAHDTATRLDRGIGYSIDRSIRKWLEVFDAGPDDRGERVERCMIMIDDERRAIEMSLDSIRFGAGIAYRARTTKRAKSSPRDLLPHASANAAPVSESPQGENTGNHRTTAQRG